jgi:hypothetical protein
MVNSFKSLIGKIEFSNHVLFHQWQRKKKTIYIVKFIRASVANLYNSATLCNGENNCNYLKSPKSEN